MALGRKKFLFAGSDAGGEVLADAMTVIETAKLSGLNPEALPPRHPRPHPYPRSKAPRRAPFLDVERQPQRRTSGSLKPGADRPVTFFLSR